LHALIFEAVTAFTNVRRLQLLRRLASGETLPAAILSATLRMSEAAVSRHMGKLRRRGYIEVVKKGRDVGYKLAARGKSRLHARLLALIQAEWQDG
jgi:DNA-binding transcriptional ArsR family regulator